jgi:leader peptidase (prepilin peptidase) / N-methyltransferase
LSAARTRWAGGLAVVLAVATFIHLGADLDAAAWACAQVALVALAAIDIATRRLPNVITIPGVVIAVVLRVLFVRSELEEVVIAGAVAFGIFFVIAIALRGGFGMGDVKLAAMLGCLLGATVVSALALGIVTAGLVSLGLVATKRATLHSTIAYGPYLAFGGAVAILAFNHPSLV